MSYFKNQTRQHYPFAIASWSSISGSGAQDPDTLTGSASGDSWIVPVDHGYQFNGRGWIEATIKLSGSTYYGYYQAATSTIDRPLGASAYGEMISGDRDIRNQSDDMAVAYSNSATYHMINMSSSGWTLKNTSRIAVMRMEF